MWLPRQINYEELSFMKLLNAKYTYPLIVLSLVVSTALQIFWLQQLFVAQRKQLKEEIEQMVGTTAQANVYYSLTHFDGSVNKEGNPVQIKKIFLSPEWQQLTTAFDNMKMLNDLNADFSIRIDNDSTAVNMHFKLKDHIAKRHPSASNTSTTGLSKEKIRKLDSSFLKKMDKNVIKNLHQLGLTSKTFYTTYQSAWESKPMTSTIPKTVKPDFISKTYSYNLITANKYQLAISSIDSLVWYRMRYYLVSSTLMILLTCAAFYFILRLLRKQQLYADARADFTSNMTHEFKTPIATVAVALESITKYNLAKDPEKLQNYLDIGLHELQRLNLMVEKVLHISQDNSNEQPLHPELYDVQAGLQQVISSMELQLQHSSERIHLKASEEPCFIFGDPVHLTNIFYNLIDNAIKYGGNPLDLQIECTCNTKTIVLLSFKDNGPGIEKIYQKNIFERFFRVPSSGDTHNIKGSGLGLHYVKLMVEKHGGTIRLISEPGKGSNFIITLPAAT